MPRTAFKSFVGQYPSGDYAGNAHYWLGELYLLDGDSERGRRSISKRLLGAVWRQPRVPDAMFKLGRIYHQEGDTARARDILDRVVNEYAGSDSTAPRLAREYLQQNF
jgi:TolA-binding protein